MPGASSYSSLPFGALSYVMLVRRGLVLSIVIQTFFTTKSRCRSIGLVDFIRSALVILSKDGRYKTHLQIRLGVTFFAVWLAKDKGYATVKREWHSAFC
jgi:hypothetical protein